MSEAVLSDVLPPGSFEAKASFSISSTSLSEAVPEMLLWISTITSVRVLLPKPAVEGSPMIHMICL